MESRYTSSCIARDRRPRLRSSRRSCRFTSVDKPGRRRLDRKCLILLGLESKSSELLQLRAVASGSAVLLALQASPTAGYTSSSRRYGRYENAAVSSLRRALPPHETAYSIQDGYARRQRCVTTDGRGSGERHPPPALPGNPHQAPEGDARRRTRFRKDREADQHGRKSRGRDAEDRELAFLRIAHESRLGSSGAQRDRPA